MVAKIFLVFCVQALLAFDAYSYCLYPGAEQRTLPASNPTPCGIAGNNGLAYGNLYSAGLPNGYTAGNIEVTPTSSGGLPISSTSAFPTTGLSITSDNFIEGNLYVFGELPFLSAVALDGVLPSAGAGFVNHGYGNGYTGITSVGNAGIGSAGITSVGNAGIGSAGITSVGNAGISGISSGIYGCDAGIEIAPAGIVGVRECGCV